MGPSCVLEPAESKVTDFAFYIYLKLGIAEVVIFQPQ